MLILNITYMPKNVAVLVTILATFTLLGAGCNKLPGSPNNEPMPPTISVADQSLSDSSEITVKEATIDQNGWIVVHTLENGQASDAIGYTSLAAGKDTKIKISIDRNKITPSLVAMLHYDREPVGTFGFPGTDGPVIKDTLVIMDEFAITNYDKIKKDTPADKPASARKEFIITAKQWAFSPASITVKKGDMVVLKVTSADVAHGLNLPDFGINETIEPGKSKTVEFVADKAGSFTFSCSVPCGTGHKAMTGMLIVE